MKLKPMLRAEINNGWKSICIFYFIEIVVVLISSIANSLAPDGVRIMSGANSSFVSVIYFSIFGIVIFKEIFSIALANGVSRRTTFLTTGIFCVMVAVLASIVDNVLNVVFENSNVFSFDFYSMMYGPSDNLILEILLKFLVSACIALFALFMGYLIGGIFYRLGKVGRVVFSVSLPTGLFFVLPVVLSILPENIMKPIGNFFENFGNFIIRSPWNLILFVLGLAVLFGLFGWLTIRRAPIEA